MARTKTPANSQYPRLTAKAAQIYDYLKEFYRIKRYPPTVREICTGLDIPSTSTVYNYLRTLEIEGYIRKTGNKTRAIEFVGTEDDPELNQHEVINAPVVGKIAAGTPILAVENVSDYLPLPIDMFHPGNEVFILEVSGESMIEAGIFDGDYVIIEKTPVAHNGEIIAAMIDDEATVKRFYKENGHIRLQPENSTMEPIIVNDATIIGKVVGLFRNYV